MGVGGLKFIQHNANPDGYRVGDCVIRTISAALGKTWDEVYLGLAIQGYLMRDLPSADRVWNAYLRRHGYSRGIIEVDSPEDYTVADFCYDHPQGDYILAMSGHVVFVHDGHYYDTWDSGDEIPIYYWEVK